MNGRMCPNSAPETPKPCTFLIPLNSEFPSSDLQYPNTENLETRQNLRSSSPNLEPTALKASALHLYSLSQAITTFRMIIVIIIAVIIIMMMMIIIVG